MENLKPGDIVIHKHFKIGNILIVAVSETNEDPNRVKYECRNVHNGELNTHHLYGFELELMQPKKTSGSSGFGTPGVY